MLLRAHLCGATQTGSEVRSSPAVAGGVVYVGSGDGRVYALNATTGAQVWNYTTGSFVFSSPAVAGGVVYVGSFDYKVYALNATTGAQYGTTQQAVGWSLLLLLLVVSSTWAHVTARFML